MFKSKVTYYIADFAAWIGICALCIYGIDDKGLAVPLAMFLAVIQKDIFEELKP